VTARGAGDPRLRVLLCDDNELLRSALRDIVDAQDDLVCVGTAANAGQALHLAERCAPDVVVMDVRFPGGGPHAARGILHLLPGVRVMAFSAYADGGSLEAMRAAGVEDYVIKGVTNAEFLAALRRTCRGPGSCGAAPGDSAPPLPGC
jgi:DNA-binding NarL/FixJ family response regulator